MPWRSQYLTTRRHPLALALYAVTLLYGIFFFTHASDVATLHQVSHAWRWLWRLEFVTGGGMGLIAAFWKVKAEPGWPDLADCIRVEAIAAFVSGMAFLTYAVSVELLFRDFSPPTLFQLGIVALFVAGFFWRAVQAIIESRRVEELGLLVDNTREQLRRALLTEHLHDALSRRDERQDED